MKRKINVIATYTFDIDFEIDENNPEFKDIMKSYTETIQSNGTVKDVLAQIIHNYYHLDSNFVEGVGDINKVEESGAIKIIRSDEDCEYDYRDLK